MSRASATPAGTLVLDSEGLAKAVLRAREVTQWLALALADDLRVITSAATVVEVAHPRLNRPALEWTLSRVVVEPRDPRGDLTSPARGDKPRNCMNGPWSQYHGPFGR